MSYLKFFVKRSNYFFVCLFVFWVIVLLNGSALGCDSCLSDLDADGNVDGNDLALFSSAYGITGCDGNIYVDATIGEDKPENGCAPDAPLKTISYAISKSSICSDTIIHVTPGIYNETLLIKTNNITLQKREGFMGNVIIDGGEQDIITIDGAKGIVLTDISVQNGKDGIKAKNGAAVRIENSTVQNVSEDGIQLEGNTSGVISGCSVQDADGNGYFIYSISYAVFTGVITASNNDKDGIQIHGSYALFWSADIIAEKNGKRGLHIIRNATVNSYNSKLQAGQNSDLGMALFSNSTLSLNDSDDYLCENNVKGGVQLSVQCSLYMKTGTSLVANSNSDRGIRILSNSILKTYGTLTASGNIDKGMDVRVSSSFEAISPANVTISGTTGQGFGVMVIDSSSFVFYGGSLIIENNTGIYGTGLQIQGNSQASIYDSTPAAQIRNNTIGVGVYGLSSASFNGDTQVNNNSDMGIWLNGNSQLHGYNLRVEANTNRGIFAQDGVSVGLDTPTVKNNGVDIKLEFQARLTMIGTIDVGTTDYEDPSLVRQ